MSKHTPGPWTGRSADHTDAVGKLRIKLRIVERIRDAYHVKFLEAAEASGAAEQRAFEAELKLQNALDEVRELRKRHSAHGPTRVQLLQENERLRAAIAKAEGKKA